MKHIKLFEDFGKIDKWEEGFKNTKNFIYYTINGKIYIYKGVELVMMSYLLKIYII